MLIFYDSLARTSYVKMIDVWLIFCLLIPLAEVLFHAVLDKYRDDRTKRLDIGCVNRAPDVRCGITQPVCQAFLAIDLCADTTLSSRRRSSCPWSGWIQNLPSLRRREWKRRRKFSVTYESWEWLGFPFSSFSLPSLSSPLELHSNNRWFFANVKRQSKPWNIRAFADF